MFRPFVQWAALRMERTLRKKDDEEYPDWETATHPARYELMHDEWWEVQEAIKPCCLEETRTPEAIEHLQQELVDLALTAMMLAGGFDEEMSKLRRGQYVEIIEDSSEC